LGLLSPPEAQNLRRDRASIREAFTTYLKSRAWLEEESPEPLAILRAWLSQLASGNAYLLLLNLEDLWLEPLPQNVPGTWEERPNWRRKARFSLDEICQMNSVAETLKVIDEIRRRERLLFDSIHCPIFFNSRTQSSTVSFTMARDLR